MEFFYILRENNEKQICSIIVFTIITAFIFTWYTMHIETNGTQKEMAEVEAKVLLYLQNMNIEGDWAVKGVDYISDNYESNVINGWNMKERMEDELSDILMGILKKDFAEQLKNATVIYPDIEFFPIEKIGQLTDHNDGIGKRISVSVEPKELTMESLINVMKILGNSIDLED